MCALAVVVCSCVLFVWGERTSVNPSLPSYNIPENLPAIISTTSQITEFYAEPQAGTRSNIPVSQVNIDATTLTQSKMQLDHFLYQYLICMSYTSISQFYSSFQKDTLRSSKWLIFRFDVRKLDWIPPLENMCCHTEQMWYHLAKTHIKCVILSWGNLKPQLKPKQLSWSSTIAQTKMGQCQILNFLFSFFVKTGYNWEWTQALAQLQIWPWARLPQQDKELALKRRGIRAGEVGWVHVNSCHSWSWANTRVGL